MESGDGGDRVIGIEKMEEQVSRRKVADHSAVDRKLETCCEKP